MPSLGVCVVVINDAGQIVLTKRADLPVWGLPGGAIEAGETLVETGIREVLEETGLGIEITRLVGLYSRPGWFDGDHTVVFAAHPMSGEPRADGEETLAAGWFDPAAPPQPLLPWHYDHIADAFGQNGVRVRRLEISVPGGLTREAFHNLRAQKQIPLDRAMLASLCAPLPPEKDKIEIG